MRNKELKAEHSQPRPEPAGDLPLVHGQFSDFDEFTEHAADWDIDFRQTSKGALSAELLQLLDPQLAISKARFDQNCLQSGASPRGMRTFALLDNGAPETRFCGQAFDTDSIALFGTNGEFESTSPSGFAVFTLSMEESWLAQLAQQAGYESAHEALPASSTVLKCNSTHLASLRIQLKKLQRSVDHALPADRVLQQLSALKQGLTVNLLSMIENPLTNDRIHQHRGRRSLLREAKEYINKHLADPVQVKDVAIMLGVTTRTLELAFRQLLDITPQGYISTARLYAVHRSLKTANPDRTVGAVAGEWGYWHLGQLARDYRARFGELPSQTLNRR